MNAFIRQRDGLEFDPDRELEPVSLARCCICAQGLLRRRFMGGLGAAAALAALPLRANALTMAMPECTRSSFTKLAISPESLEHQAGQQYAQMLSQASEKRSLAPMDHPQLQRLRYIADRIIPVATSCNPRARAWHWEVNLLGSSQLNAFCMPGGKIVFYFGILQKLQLDDDEVAMIMGHEISHALLEHAAARMGKSAATQGAVAIGSALLGLGNLGHQLAGAGAQLLTLKFSREDEEQADALGLRLAARAGYDPQAGVTLWRKMMAASQGAPPQWLSTHPSGSSRVHDIESRLAAVSPDYAAAERPSRRFTPPPPSHQRQSGETR
jgi:predicted Zn-dependent protease